MITVSVKDNIQQIIREMKAHEKAVQKAQISALNKAAKGAKVQMTRVITAGYRVSAALVRERLIVKGAKRGGAHEFEAKLIGNPNTGGKLRSMNLIHFAQSKLNRAEKAAWKKQEADARGRVSRPQIPFQIKKNGRRVNVKGAFIGNDGRTVFVRTGDKRLPIKAVQTIGIPQMFMSKHSINDIKAWLRDNFPRIFAHELKFYMSKG